MASGMLMMMLLASMGISSGRLEAKDRNDTQKIQIFISQEVFMSHYRTISFLCHSYLASSGEH